MHQCHSIQCIFYLVMYSVIFFKSGCYMDYEKYSYGTSTNILHIVNIFLEQILALAGVAQWIEHWPMNQRVSGSIPSQGIYLGCRPDLQLGV